MDALPAYVINLDSQPARWQMASSQLDRLGLEHERFPAVNGAALSQADLDRRVDWEATRKWKFNVTPPEIGVYLSHISIINQIARDKRPGAFIFEDDFVASDDLPAVVRVLSQCEFDRPLIVRLHTPPRQLAFPVFQRPLADGLKLSVPFRIPPSAIAYYINRAAAQTLASYCNVFYMPVDCQFRHHWQTGVDVLMVSPAPVQVADSSYRDSNLEADRKYRRRWLTRIRHWRRISYREGFNVIHLPGRVIRAMRS